MSSLLVDAKRALRRMAVARRTAKRLRRLLRPARLGTIRRTSPLSGYYGIDRGTPVDRHYIDRFFAEQRRDISGHVLEIKENSYTARYGLGVDRVDLLDIDPTNPNATIIADLAQAGTIPSESFDCFVLPQTLMFVYDLRSAVEHIHRILRPGGVALATVTATGRISPEFVKHDYWRFTANSCARLFGQVFGADHVTVRSYGNVLACVASLMGMAREELSRRELDVNDPQFPLVIVVRAVR